MPPQLAFCAGAGVLDAEIGGLDLTLQRVNTERDQPPVADASSLRIKKLFRFQIGQRRTDMRET